MAASAAKKGEEMKQTTIALALLAITTGTAQAYNSPAITYMQSQSSRALAAKHLGEDAYRKGRAMRRTSRSYYKRTRKGLYAAVAQDHARQEYNWAQNNYAHAQRRLEDVEADYMMGSVQARLVNDYGQYE